MDGTLTRIYCKSDSITLARSSEQFLEKRIFLDNTAASIFVYILVELTNTVFDIKFNYTNEPLACRTPVVPNNWPLNPIQCPGITVSLPTFTFVLIDLLSLVKW